MKFWLFHRHSYNPYKWDLIDTMKTYGDSWGQMTDFPTSIHSTYSNTCLTCGDIVFKRVTL